MKVLPVCGQSAVCTVRTKVVTCKVQVTYNDSPDKMTLMQRSSTTQKIFGINQVSVKNILKNAKKELTEYIFGIYNFLINKC